MTITQNTTAPIAGITNNAGTTVLNCVTTSINVTATGGNSYAWSGGTTPATAANSFTTPATYTVTGTNGCTATSSLTLTQTATPPSVGITNNIGGATQLTCALTTINVTATGGGTYVWSGGAALTTATNSFTTLGTYTVTITEANGCTASSSIVITQDISIPVPSITTNSPVCAGSNLLLDANNGTSYSWSGPAGFSSNIENPSINAVTQDISGVYTVTVTGYKGCTATEESTVVVNSIPVAGFTYTATGLTVSFTNSSTSASTYNWDFSGINSTVANPVYTFPADGQYNVSLIAINGNCSDTTSQLITVSGVGIATYEINSINIYPNPTSGVITLKLEAEANNALMTIVDVTDRVVFQKTVNGSEETINLPHFAPGVYEVKLDLDKRVLHQRLIVK